MIRHLEFICLNFSANAALTTSADNIFLVRHAHAKSAERVPGLWGKTFSAYTVRELKFGSCVMHVIELVKI